MTAPVIFIKSGVSSLIIPIPTDPSHRDAALNKQAILSHRDQVIKFKHIVSSGLAEPKCSFTTEKPSLIKFLNNWNKKNGGRELKVDTSMMPLKCPYCGFETPDGSENSQSLLAQHILDAHSGSILDEGEEEIPLEELSLEALKIRAREAGLTDEQLKGSLTSKTKLVALILGTDAPEGDE